MLTGTLFIVGAYLWAAIPSAYLVGRYRKGIDIRDYGTGSVGATNVMTHVGRRTGWLLGAFDCLAKGTLPVLVAKAFDQDLSVQLGVGTAAIAGHNWSIYLRFTGGRGVATSVGVVLGFLMWPEFLILTVVMGGLGWLVFKETALWTLVAMVALPVLALLFDRPAEVFFMTVTIGGLLILKRLTANWEALPEGYSLLQVLRFRLFWDRDVPRKGHWMRRGPRSQVGDSA